MSNEQGTYSVFGVNNSTLIPFPDFYDTMYFGGDSKTYRELVYTSRIKDTLNLTIEVLTNDSKTSRLALRNDRKKSKGEQIEIPRPQNAWIIYRRDKYVTPEFEGIKPSSKKFKNRQRQQHKRNTSPETEETTLNQDLPQLVVNPPSSIKEYPTPVSSIQLSPVTDFSEQANEISYLMTPASSNHQSPVTSQYGSSDILTPESLNQQTPITSEDILSSMMYPQFSEITPISTYNNNSRVFSEDFLKFLYSADILALQPSTYVTYNTGIPDMTFNTDIPAIPAPDMTLNDMTFVPATPAPDTDIPATLETLTKFIFTNMNDQNKDFDLYPESERQIPNITPPVAEPMTTSMQNQIFQDIFQYDSNALFSIHATPVEHYYDGSSF
ncbi:2050_t:CDS:2 [Rhizophagus irregularis]|nr:2050_t:CDS:2 [Rhizophagus irregularis]